MPAARIIAAAVVRNERHRVLERWLRALRPIADVMVVLDDASDDGTAEAILATWPDVHLTRLPQPLLQRHETVARARLWELVRAVARPGDWVLLVDADEVPSDPLVEAAAAIRMLPARVERLDARLAELWDEGRWRSDGHWSPWMTFFVRFRDVPFHPDPEQGPTYHASRLPAYAHDLVPHPLDAPVLHLGYSTPALREAKSRHYMAINTGINLQHARTILAPPTLRDLRVLTEPARALVALPIRDRAWVVPQLTRSLELLAWPDDRLEILFLLNGSTDETEPLLRAWQRSSQRHVRIETLDLDAPPPRGDHQWWGPPSDPQGPYRRMAALRNVMLDRLIDSGADAMLALDSDVLLDPRTLGHLIATGEDIVSPVFWAGWGMGLPPRAILPPALTARPDIARLARLAARGKLPQVWERGGYSTSPELLADLMARRGLHPVGGLGAATLIRRAVALAGVTYDDVPNLPEDIAGEDRHFCVRAVCHHFRLMATSYLPTVHCDDPSETADYDDVLRPLAGVHWPTLAVPGGVPLTGRAGKREP